jgi:hypothetical protein
MALQQAISLPAGFDLPEAYVRIDSVTFTHHEVLASVVWFANVDARQALAPTVKQAVFSLACSAPFSLATIYAQLKALPDFAGAADV